MLSGEWVSHVTEDSCLNSLDSANRAVFQVPPACGAESAARCHWSRASAPAGTHPRLRLFALAAATNPLAPPAAGEILPAALAVRVRREARVLLPRSEPSLPPRPGSLQSPATLAISGAHHTIPQSAASPSPWPSSHWHAAPRWQIAAHTRLPRHGAAPTPQAPSPPESVPRATGSGPVPPAKPTLLPHSRANPASNPVAASVPAMPAPPAA